MNILDKGIVKSYGDLKLLNGALLVLCLLSDALPPPDVTDGCISRIFIF
jgi:hypothetical protein